MEINLLPKKQPNYQTAWFVWGFTVVFIIAFGLLFWEKHQSLIQEQSDLQNRLNQLNQQATAIQKQNAIQDPRFAVLQKFEQERSNLAKSQVDWEARLNDLALNMPKYALVNTIAYHAPDITLTGSIDTLTTAAQFSETLKKLDWVANVSITTVANSSHSSNSNTDSVSNPLNSQIVGDQVLNDSFTMTIHTKDVAPNPQGQGAQK